MSNEHRLLQEQLAALREEALRRTEDEPLRSWVPHGKQRPFIQEVLVNGGRETWFCGANRSGKSDVGAYIGATLARFGRTDPDSGQHEKATSGWVVGLDWPTLRGTIQPKYFNNGYTSPGQNPPFIPDREIEAWTQSAQVLKLKNGSLIEFKSADSGQEKFQGAGKQWIHFDEVPPKGVYDESVIRIEAGSKLQIIGTATLLPPPGMRGGVSWLYSEKIKPWQNGELPGFQVFTASMYDNPHLRPEEIAYVEALFPPGSPMRAIRVDGALIPGVSGARVYGKFERRIHLKNLEVDPRQPLCWAWDFNVSPMITLVGQRDTKGFRVLDELIIRDGASIPVMCDMFYHSFADHPSPVWIYGDATGTHRNTSIRGQKTDFDIIWNEMRKFGTSLKMKVPERNPWVADRVNAVNRQLEDEYGEINLYVDPRCTELIEDLEDVIADPQGGIKKVRDPRDPYFFRTHASDALGYWVAYEAPVRRHSIVQEYGRKIRTAAYGFTH